MNSLLQKLDSHLKMGNYQRVREDLELMFPLKTTCLKNEVIERDMDATLTDDKYFLETIGTLCEVRSKVETGHPDTKILLDEICGRPPKKLGPKLNLDNIPKGKDELSEADDKKNKPPQGKPY